MCAFLSSRGGFIPCSYHIRASYLQLKRMTMTADGKGAVFDVDSKALDQFISKCGDTTASGGHLIVPSTLPELKHKVRTEDVSKQIYVEVYNIELCTLIATVTGILLGLSRQKTPF